MESRITEEERKEAVCVCVSGVFPGVYSVCDGTEGEDPGHFWSCFDVLFSSYHSVCHWWTLFRKTDQMLLMFYSGL